jgi:hypothetical protein
MTEMEKTKIIDNIVANTVLNVLACDGFTPHVFKQKVRAVVRRKFTKRQL